MVSTEYWDRANVFKGDLCRFDGPQDKDCEGYNMEGGLCCAMAMNGEKNHGPQDKDCEGYNMEGGLCCAMAMNGGKNRGLWEMGWE